MAWDLAPMAVTWLALAYKFASTRRGHPTPANRTLLQVLIFLCLATMFVAPPIYRWVGMTTGLPNVAILVATAFGLLCYVPALNLLLYRGADAVAAARRRTRRWVLFGLLVALQIVLWSRARGTEIDPAYAINQAPNPDAVAFLLVQQIALFITGIICYRACRRLLEPTVGALRAGLWLVAFSGAVAVLLVAFNLAFYAVALYQGAVPAAEFAPAFMTAVLYVSVCALAVGATLPDWGPRVLHRWRVVRSLRQLTPLWTDLVSAVPSVELPDAYPRWSTERRLHRRVVEIRDAELALRRYRQAPRHAPPSAAGVTDDERSHRALIEAVALAQAVRTRLSGAPAASAPHGEQREGGADLKAEVQWLVEVARHYPAVRELVGRPGAPPPAPRSTPSRPTTARTRARAKTVGL